MLLSGSVMGRVQVAWRLLPGSQAGGLSEGRGPPKCRPRGLLPARRGSPSSPVSKTPFFLFLKEFCRIN